MSYKKKAKGWRHLNFQGDGVLKNMQKYREGTTLGSNKLAQFDGKTQSMPSLLEMVSQAEKNRRQMTLQIGWHYAMRHIDFGSLPVLNYNKIVFRHTKMIM